MIVEYAVPIIVTMEGPKENLDRPCDTETRIYLEMMIDQGDAEVIPIADVPTDWASPGSLVTHRIVTSLGGVFHARMIGGRRERLEVAPPRELSFLFAATEAINRWCQSNVTQIAALRVLEDEVAALRKELGR